MVWKWQWRGDSVTSREGAIRSNRIAAFNFINTLIWSECGLPYMYPSVFTNDAWVPTVSLDTLIKVFNELIRDEWTIVIFISDEYDLGIGIISKFFDSLIAFGTKIEPFVYVSGLGGKNIKPNRGMRDMFLTDTRLQPSQASFYCGDEMGPQSRNPLYQMGSVDFDFAQNCGLSFYTPDDILGVFKPIEDVSEAKVLLVMAAHNLQYQDFLNDLLDKYTFQVSILRDVRKYLELGKQVIIIPDDRKFATQAERRAAANDIPKEYHNDTKIIMFTRPIKPFIDEEEYKESEPEIRKYVENMDFRINLRSDILKGGPRQEPFDIIRIN